MSDFIAGPASGARKRATGLGGGGAPPPVLIAAMSAAALIAATLVALLLSSGGGEPVPAGVDAQRESATTPADDRRVLLTVQIEGGGSGRVLLDPRGVACSETCERDFATGTRVSVTADAAKGSRFDEWSDACTGRDRCSLVMDRARSVTATFDAPPAISQCDDGRDNDRDGLVDAADPGCGADDTEAPDDRAAGASDCEDGRDNDGDGLVDRAQDPGCAADGTEADADAAPTTNPTPAPASSECTDGRDNDGDGLVDRAQDPGCRASSTEGATQSPSECRDGRDNDGDGLVDRPADPGCDADGSETGPR